MKYMEDENLNTVKIKQRPAEHRDGQAAGRAEEEDELLADIEYKVKAHKRRFWKDFLSALVMGILVIAGTYFLIEYELYRNVTVLDRINISSARESLYTEFADGLLQYNKDGAAYIDMNGKEKWNHPCQVQNPFAEANKTAAVIADKGGNDILVFEKKGLKGEIHTNLPIEKVSVSGQGIVCAILKDGSSPKVMCYDAAGNIIAEQKVSVAAVGYPMDVVISEDGYTMAVSYMQFAGGTISSKVSYYNLKDTDGGQTDHPVTGKDYPGEIIPEIFFLDNQTSVAVGDQTVLVYSGAGNPELDAKITVDKEIKSVFHSDKYFGLVLKNNEKGGCLIRLYNKKGKLVMSDKFAGDYNNVKMSGNHIMMYDGKKASIFKKSGVHKFEGEMPQGILEMFPLKGINKYGVVTTDGIVEIRLAK